MSHTHTLPPDVPAPRLHIEDKGSVCRYLYSLRASWRTIGTFLNIQHSSLEVILCDNQRSEERLLDMVAVWLTRAEPSPTWPALADAVQDVNDDLAQRIRREKCQNLQ